MKNTFIKSLLATAIIAGVSAPTFAYEAGDFLVRVGAGHVAPNDDSGQVLGQLDLVENDGVGVNSNTQLALTLNYFFADNWAFEVLAATPFSHDIYATGDTAGALTTAGLSTKIGETKHLPPTFSFQYFPAAKDAAFQPYFGIGLNYTTFFEDNSSDDLTTGLDAVLTTVDVQSTDIRLSDSFGLSLQAGFDYAINENWSFNTSVWYMDIDTDADVYVNGGHALTVDVEIDPWVAMVGFGYSF